MEPNQRISTALAIIGGLLSVTLLALAISSTAGAGENSQMEHRTLTPAEERVIVHQGTEPPWSGRFVQHHADGTYSCKRCGAELFRSADKFDSGSGWPSFDDALPGAVERRPDPDGERVEVVCARCGGHLGHLFEGERMTAKNQRYCVNSLSLDFEPRATAQPETARAIFAGGCFWGVEYYFERAPGVLRVTSGYTGGHVADRGYRAVTTGRTGHAEAVEVVFDPARTDFEQLARLFFEIHDPTQAGGQGPDIGPQYRSAVFYLDRAQRHVTERLIAELERRGYPVVTEVVEAGAFYAAEQYHQDYYASKGTRPYCHSRVRRFGS
jgi:peptide methionine sulfoxide reductase msrA/msrB